MECVYRVNVEHGMGVRRPLKRELLRASSSWRDGEPGIMVDRLLSPHPLDDAAIGIHAESYHLPVPRVRVPDRVPIGARKAVGRRRHRTSPEKLFDVGGPHGENAPHLAHLRGLQPPGVGRLKCGDLLGNGPQFPLGHLTPGHLRVDGSTRMRVDTGPSSAYEQPY